MQWVGGWVHMEANLYYLEIVLLLDFCCYITRKNLCKVASVCVFDDLLIFGQRLQYGVGFFECADFEDIAAYQLSLVEDTNAVTQLV